MAYGFYNDKSKYTLPNMTLLDVMRYDSSTDKVKLDNRGLFIIQTHDVAVSSFNANANSYPVLALSKAGYKAAGIVGLWWLNGTGAYLDVNIAGYEIANDGSIHLVLRNKGSSAASGTMRCFVLWIREELIE